MLETQAKLIVEYFYLTKGLDSVSKEKDIANVLEILISQYEKLIAE